MTITKNVSNYNDVLLDIQTQFGTISQQEVLTKIIFNFGICAILQIRAVSEFFRSLFFYAYLAVRQECSMFTKVNIPFVCVANSLGLVRKKKL